MRRLFSILFLFAGFFATSLLADTWTLLDGQTKTGELLVASANEQGVQLKLGEGNYERVPWANFSQDDLRKFAKNPKMQPFVEPLIEVSPEERIKKTEVPDLKQPPRLERPVKHSLIGAFFGSGLGLFILLVLYAANIYAGYEVAIFRAQQVPLVCGVSAILPVLGPIIFLSIPMKMPVTQQEASWDIQAPEGATAAPVAGAAATADPLNPMQGDPVAQPGGLRLAATPEEPETPDKPAPTIFQRGQFTFNRRFFETKFPGFFSVVKREADRDMVLLIKSSRGEYVGTRITRIAANDLHLEVHRGNASEEVMIPFQEVKEIQLKHKDA